MKFKIYLFIFIISSSLNTTYAKLSSPLKSNECLKDASQGVNKICNNEQSYSNPTILHRLGPGKDNVVQGLTLDVDKRILYSLHVTGKPEAGVLNRFIGIDGEKNLVANDYQNPSSMIGHQGIASIPGTDWILSSAGEGVKNKGWYITYFKYSPYSAPTSLSTVRIFDNNYSKTTSSMPIVTPNGKSLLIRSKKNGHNIIRVYDLNEINIFKTHDISNESNFEWQVDDSLTHDKYFFQAMTAGNKFIYLLSGLSGGEHKRLYIYTLNGKLVNKANDVTIGETDAIESGIEQHWEPEGMTVDSKNSELYILFAIGDKGKRVGNVYKIKIHDEYIK